jgi:hypothetical protein
MKRRQPPFDCSTLLPLGAAVALMDRETQQHLVLWLRDRAADRLGLSDPFAGLDLTAAEKGDHGY